MKGGSDPGEFMVIQRVCDQQVIKSLYAAFDRDFVLFVRDRSV
jgi:hypothetical protein